MSETLAGLGTLIRLVLRRDRVRLPLWIGALVVLMAYSAVAVADFYATPEALAGYASGVSDNPALIVFAGPGYGLAEDPTMGAVLVNETSLWMALACALMSIFLVARHTRAEEENERADLLRSTVVGRHTPLAAVLVVAVAANLVVGVASTVLSVLAGFSLTGSVALCGSFAAVGVVFAAVTAVTAQLVSTGRAAMGSAATAAGFFFLLRGIGDIGPTALSWASPFGWGIGVRAFAGERWWVFAGVAVMAVAAAVAAVRLSSYRDLGSGLVASRPGPATGSARGSGPLGLALRLQRGAFAGWAAGVFVLAGVYGSVADEVEKMVADNPQLADYLAALVGQGSVTDLYLATALRLMAMLVCGYAIASMLRARSEESAGFAEAMLAAPLRRSWYLGSHLVVTATTSVALVAVAGAGIGVGYAVAVGDGSQFLRLLGTAMAVLPAVALVEAVTLALIGWVPRLAVAAWGLLAAMVVIGLFAGVLRLPVWVRDLSPLEHVDALPGAAWQPLPAFVLGAAALTLGLSAFAGFGRRDLNAG